MLTELEQRSRWMGRRDLRAPKLYHGSLGELCESRREDGELSSRVVNVQGKRREHQYKLGSYLVPGSVLESLFNLILVIEVRMLLLK